MRARGIIAGSLAIVAGVAGIVHFTAASGPPSVDLTWSKGQCQTALFCANLTGSQDYDVVRVHVDCAATCDTNALAFTDYTGHINTLDVVTEGQDGLKIRGRTHDVTVDDGQVVGTRHYPGTHQDCMQALSGRDVLVKNVMFACHSATNAQWYIDGLGDVSKPTNVVCDGCSFFPGGFHSVTIGLSDSSGVRNSLVCPGLSQGLQFDVHPDAANFVDVNNVKPWPASADPRCVNGQPGTTTVGTTTAPTQPPTTSTVATTTAATTTDQTTTQATTTTAAETLAPQILSGFTKFRCCASLYARWKAANPNEAARLEAYVDLGGPKPIFATATGQALADFAEGGYALH